MSDAQDGSTPRYPPPAVFLPQPSGPNGPGYDSHAQPADQRTLPAQQPAPTNQPPRGYGQPPAESQAPGSIPWSEQAGPQVPAAYRPPGYSPVLRSGGDQQLSRAETGPPESVVLAMQLLVVRCGIDVLAAILNASSHHADAIDALILAAIGFTLAVRLRQGRNWARKATWVFVGLKVVFSVANLFSAGHTPVQWTVAVIGELMDVLIIVSLARRSSSEYFR